MLIYVEQKQLKAFASCRSHSHTEMHSAEANIQGSWLLVPVETGKVVVNIGLVEHVSNTAI